MDLEERKQDHGAKRLGAPSLYLRYRFFSVFATIIVDSLRNLQKS